MLLELLSAVLYLAFRVILLWLTYTMMMTDYYLLRGVRHDYRLYRRWLDERRAIYEQLFAVNEFKRFRYRG